MATKSCIQEGNKIYEGVWRLIAKLKEMLQSRLETQDYDPLTEDGFESTSI